jgi:hypothetical protein
MCDLGVGRRRRGPLSPAERQLQRRYDEHLASCDDCRVMARLNADVDPLGDVRPGDEAVVAAAADLALSRLGRIESAVGRRRALPGLMVVVLMLGTSAGAVAARRHLVRLASTVAETLFPTRRTLRRDQRVAPPVRSRSRATGVVAPVASNPAAESRSTAAPEVPMVVPAPVPAAVPAPVVVAVAQPQRLRQVRQPEGVEPLVWHDVPGSPMESHGQPFAPRPSPPPTARALLASGTAARARGDRAAAVAFFRQLQLVYPAAKESQVALVSAGQLLLDGADFSGALAAFGAYRARDPAGPLVEEALDGAARALAGLGRDSEERAVWREMVARFPGSAYLPRATQRLRALR